MFVCLCNDDPSILVPDFPINALIRHILEPLVSLDHSVRALPTHTFNLT